MPEERLTKNQRREAAREMARAAREKAKRRDRMRKWLIPTVAVVVILGLAGGITWIAISTAPGPQSEAGPKNMISDGIRFVGQDGEAVPVETAAIPPSGTPTPTDPGDLDVPLVRTYVDFSCPGCKNFEAGYADSLQQLVAAGEIALEVHPVAILDRNYLTSRYSSRANNVAACVANYAPDEFLDVMAEMYAQQPDEGTSGLDNGEIVRVVHDAGLESDEVDTCIRDEYFAPWVASATQRTLSMQELLGPRGFATPTVMVNDQRWDSSAGDLLTFIQQVAAGE